ncbi:hypothetical protein BB8028_0002g01650 [Beauveria bassiana]|uniref:Uncharacterized protein n=1 Tax=Beauveria bassiana TaxID=176275 RepID=A0A2S7Y152_BEABA|nr:hypothetical protein BB8028_0002g01650 [Beauveria bassiana]
MYKLSDKDPRRKRVESWLRTGCPLLAFTNHWIYRPDSARDRRKQNAFKARRAGEMETPFVKIDTLESSKETLLPSPPKSKEIVLENLLHSVVLGANTTHSFCNTNQPLTHA